jgi:endoglucanase
MRGLYILFLFLVSCQKDAVPPAELVVSLERIQVTAAGGDFTFHVKSNREYAVSTPDPWISLFTKAGSSGTTTVQARAEANAGKTERIANILIRIGEEERQVKVLQKGAAFIDLAAEVFQIPAQGQEIQVYRESSGSVRIEELPFWIERVEKKLKIKENPSIYPRIIELSLKVEGLTVPFKISQEAKPRSLEEDRTGVEKNAVALRASMGLGWNLGNSLEACADPFTASETLWGNPATSKALIDLVKRSGFNAVRIPAAWSGYIEDRVTHKVKDEWLMRVREVVDYCMANDMHAVLNIHWDGGWLENNPTYARQQEVNAKQKALWEQIAVTFRDYDERLLFAGTNEVHADYNRPSNEHLEVQHSYNQTFVDAVRATGGKNAWRVLVVQGYNTNIEYTLAAFKLPKDRHTDRLMLEVHYYDPYDFTIDNSSNFKYLWGKEYAGQTGASTWVLEEYVVETFGKMKTQFVDRGIPVLLGEYAASLRTTLPEHLYTEHVRSRNHYLYYVTFSALKHGLIPFYWDNGGIGNQASGLFDRGKLTVAHPDALEAIQRANR